MKKIVVFTGAGISAESGLQTFRDANGLWEGYKVEDVATPRAWAKNPAQVLEFYNQRRRSVLEAKPNEAHIIIAELEKEFEVDVITQNIDDLHERAGSSNILHLHGEILKMRSEQNESFIYPIQGDINVGDKAEDGSQLRPHIVWFEEAVPMMDEAIRRSIDCDYFVVVGTSLVVYPAASILHYLPPFMPIYLIDKNPPALSRNNLTVIAKPATEGMKELKNILIGTRI